MKAFKTKSITHPNGSITDEFFYPNGVKQKEMNYNKEIELHGNLIEWDENGKIIFKTFYKNDLRHGLSYSAHYFDSTINDMKICEAYFINDSEDGEIIIYSPQ